MRRLLISALALALAGCGGEEVANNSATPTPSPTPGPMLGGVELNKPIRASGTTPHWAIYIAPGTITYADAPGAAPRDLYPASPRLMGGAALVETRTPEGDAVTITLTAAACGTGKAPLPLTAEVRIGSRVLKGCAGQGAYDWATPRPGAEPSNATDAAPANTARAR
ncbi:putative membrane protein [Sphingomonas naasensis]|uniref:Lipoprotein n=1 Tax=Sphingomonas naasensis TaxID=1344951 RepID=A0A4S1W4S8_9SPHN|nr:hypothetical protein [Sphingomonas naasensis]NIJ20646.1 putative membrane protein [Sphingomonas naasensis]TGX37629.1 hypothetical protein E5A74_19990 [Sphingomonas naasensis]